MKQLSTDTRWPSGCAWTIGLLDRSPEQIQQLGVHFDRAEDDLDTLQTAVLYDRSVGLLRLLSRDHAPIRGVEVQVDASISRDRGLSALVRQLGLDRDALSWITEDPEYIGFRPQVAPAAAPVSAAL